MKNSDIIQTALKQLAIDLNCKPEDFLGSQNKVVLNELLVGRRRYFTKPRFCHMACFGNAAIAAVDESIQDFVSRFMERYQTGYDLFNMPQLSLIDDELNKFGKCIGRIQEYFLPDITAKLDLRTEFEIKVLSEDDIPIFCQNERFENALGLGANQKAERHDMLAVVCYHDKKVIGVAAACNDTDILWQIGIDVVPEYRGLGVASVLTGKMRDEIFARGKIPYYGSAWANIASKRTAIHCGFKPAWVEMQSVDKA